MSMDMSDEDKKALDKAGDQKMESSGGYEPQPNSDNYSWKSEGSMHGDYEAKPQSAGPSPEDDDEVPDWIKQGVTPNEVKPVAGRDTEGSGIVAKANEERKKQGKKGYVG